MLNLELIPFIGYEIDVITPHDIYEDMDNQSDHYSMLSKSMENKLDAIKNYKELKTNMRFQEAKKIIKQKEFLGIHEYDKICSVMAQEMGIKEEGQNIKQKFDNELNQIIKRRGKFQPM